MTSEQLRLFLIKTGEALHGARWQTSLAKDLRTADRTMRRWASGENEVPWGIAAELRGLLMARGVEIAKILKEMDSDGRPDAR